MKLLYLGTEMCRADTLQRLILLADEICFLDRPSVRPIGQWGTVGLDNPMRQFTTGSNTVKFSAFKSPDGHQAGGIYEYYAEADVSNPNFVRVFLDGMRDNDKFAHKYLQPQANYGNNIDGLKLRQLLAADKTLYQASFDLSAKSDPSIIYEPDRFDGRKAVLQMLLVDASIRITGALLMADEIAAVPIADDEVHPQLLALRVSNQKYIGATPSLAPFLGLQFVRAVIPDEMLKRLEFSDIIAYREKSKDIYAAWNVEINNAAAKIADTDMLHPNEAVKKIIATDFMPRIRDYENEMENVRDKLFGDIVKSVVSWELPTVSVGYLAHLGFTDALQAFAASVDKAAIAGAVLAGARATVPHVVDFVNSRRAATRKHAVSYLIGLTKR